MISRKEYDPLFEVCRSIISSKYVKLLRSEAEAELHRVAQSAQLPMDTVLRVTSAWGYKQPWVQRTARQLAPEINNTLCQIGCPSTFAVSEMSDATLFVQNGVHDNRTHAHQDIAYKWNQDSQARYALTTWLALDSCDGESGALRFSDGYPKQPVSVRVDNFDRGHKDLAETDEWRVSESIARVDAGDMVVFDSLVWHSSQTAEGGAIRMALAIRWKSVDGWEEDVELRKPSLVADEFGMDNSGKLLIDAIRRLQQAERSGVVSEPLKTHQVVDHFMSQSQPLLNNLKPETRVAITDLSVALRLLNNHHARIASRVWIDVRDVVLPDMRRLLTDMSS